MQWHNACRLILRVASLTDLGEPLPLRLPRLQDETDVLADRVAMLVRGAVHSVGTTIFLKRAFNVGYQLTVTRAVAPATGSQAATPVGGGARRPSAADGGVGTARPTLDSPITPAFAPHAGDAGDAGDAVAVIEALVRSHVPDATTTSTGSDGSNEVVFRLPLASSPSFAALFAALEALQHGGHAPSVDASVIGAGGDEPEATLRSPPAAAGCASPLLSSFGLNITTMEDVFLQIVAQTSSGNATPGKAPAKALHASVDVSSPAAGAALRLPAASPAEAGKTPSSPAATTPSTPASRAAASQRPAGCCWQLFALIVKRLLYAKRDARGCCMVLLLPVVIIFLGFGLLKLGQGGEFARCG